ncbi:DUF447 domain-containing protein [Stygiolobus caldivivus]|uniref:DUF447 family protein n=1 Tax=Stygiolobus caldivivus TaxID=2824673 RepID=A0A8D5ZG34_9CREN|nr:DUF447 domain-containing protein [Stygiolobus caldivivus]BCU70633.1 hypothetical protein KN1_19300 [Stygiolobus caldivivus]
MSLMSEYINKVFPHEGVFEIILGTAGISENLAPIGLIRHGDDFFSKIFKNTLTYANLKVKKSCIVNISLDPKTFYILLFNSHVINKVEIVKREYDNIPYLENSLSILSECIEIENKDNFSIFKYNFIKLLNNGTDYRAFSRGDALLIDLLVHITRLDIFSEEELAKYSSIIEYEIKTIARLSPDKLDIVRDLIERINAKGLKISL